MSNSNPDPSTTTETNSTHREGIAAAFGRDLDPLAEHAPTFERLDFDPFEAFRADILDTKDLAEKTLDSWTRCFGYWRNYMFTQDRHPACPTEQHVIGFIEHLREHCDHGEKHTQRRLTQLERVVDYWGKDAAFPHSTDFNPFDTASDKVSVVYHGPKDYHKLDLDVLREHVGKIKHVRDRAIVVLQLKLGLRASEVTNLRLADFNLRHPDLRQYYPEIGTHPQVAHRDNALHIAPSDERDGNKSDRPRVLPLDDELRQVLLAYLLPRPTHSQEWLFLTSSASKMRPRVVRQAWQDAFWPEYTETNDHRAINSHFGRHWFSTFWRAEEDLNRELLKYMRGDKTEESVTRPEALDAYLHTRYEHIEDVYRERIFKLHV